MFRVSGQVTIKETSVGVPNLEVVAYDCKGHVKASGAKVRAADVLRQLGRRIAAVTTDAQGRFTMETDRNFQIGEQRPDLMVAVFAPEEVRDVDRPVPLPPDRRLLYVSASPRFDAGGEETYVIRLLLAQIEKFGLEASASGQKGRSDGVRYADNVHHAYAFKDAVKVALKSRLKAEVEKHTKRRKDAKKFFKNLSGIPRHLRDDPKAKQKNDLSNNKLLIVGKANLSKELPKKQTKSVSDGLTRIANSSRKPVLRMRVSPDELEKLGLAHDGSAVSGNISRDVLHAMLKSRVTGMSLIKVRGLDNPSPDELERRYLTKVQQPPAEEAPGNKIEEAPNTAEAPPAKTTARRKAKGEKS